MNPIAVDMVASFAKIINKGMMINTIVIVLVIGICTTVILLKINNLTKVNEPIETEEKEEKN